MLFPPLNARLRRAHRQAAFTLIELLVLVSIISLLAALILPLIRNTLGSGTEGVLKIKYWSDNADLMIANGVRTFADADRALTGAKSTAVDFYRQTDTNGNRVLDSQEASGWTLNYEGQTFDPQAVGSNWSLSATGSPIHPQMLVGASFDFDTVFGHSLENRTLLYNELAPRYNRGIRTALGNALLRHPDPARGVRVAQRLVAARRDLKAYIMLGFISDYPNWN